MTGAQEDTLNRLKKKHRDMSVKTKRGELCVVWTERSEWGGDKQVEATVTSEGRVIIRP